MGPLYSLDGGCSDGGHGPLTSTAVFPPQLPTVEHLSYTRPHRLALSHPSRHPQLYINNLNTKTKKSQLKAALLAVFSQFGKVLDVVACKTKKLRGQAWVVFSDVTSAADALRQMQGFPFFDKPLRLAFAKEKSDAVVRAEGGVVGAAGAAAGGKRKRAATAEGAAAGGSEPPSKRAAPAAAAAAFPPPAAPAVVLPSNVLLATGLPMDGSVSGPALEALFGTYPGFKAARFIQERGIAFLEYESESAAVPALQVRA